MVPSSPSWAPDTAAAAGATGAGMTIPTLQESPERTGRATMGSYQSENCCVTRRRPGALFPLSGFGICHVHHVPGSCRSRKRPPGLPLRLHGPCSLEGVRHRRSPPRPSAPGGEQGRWGGHEPLGGCGVRCPPGPAAGPPCPAEGHAAGQLGQPGLRSTASVTQRQPGRRLGGPRSQQDPPEAGQVPVLPRTAHGDGDQSDLSFQKASLMPAGSPPRC